MAYEYVKMQSKFAKFCELNSINSTELEEHYEYSGRKSNKIIYYDKKSAIKAIRLLSTIIGGSVCYCGTKLFLFKWDVSFEIIKEKFKGSNYYLIEVFISDHIKASLGREGITHLENFIKNDEHSKSEWWFKPENKKLLCEDTDSLITTFLIYNSHI